MVPYIPRIRSFGIAFPFWEKSDYSLSVGRDIFIRSHLTVGQVITQLPIDQQLPQSEGFFFLESVAIMRFLSSTCIPVQINPKILLAWFYLQLLIAQSMP